MNQRVTHISRDPLPWRDATDTDTECGKPSAEFASVVSAEEAMQQIKRLGIQRAGLTLCMTCLSVFQRYSSWPRRDMDIAEQLTFEERPMERLCREGGKRRTQLDQELRAMAALIKRHPTEFAALADGLDLDKLALIGMWGRDEHESEV